MLGPAAPHLRHKGPASSRSGGPSASPIRCVRWVSAGSAWRQR